ncbi:uncharacterized protein LOC127725426 [Mytilus californianus]|uniref:uncharacterized protein LOC127725426 n=1 Tax=Mytilus californianus TaxID=6549 RepID=UPI002245B16E|nr:uncharacterized protein LOC127725426 [Mytilus californianus]
MLLLLILLFQISYRMGISGATVCPDDKAWSNRAKTFCSSTPRDYHCIYDIECQLIEDCRPSQTNDRITLYFVEQNTELFNIKTVPVMSTNSSNYHKLQYITLCRSNLNHVQNSSPSRKNDSYKICCIAESVILGLLVIGAIWKYRQMQYQESEASRKLIEKDCEIERLKRENCDFKEQLDQLKEEKNYIEEQLVRLKEMNGEKPAVENRFTQESSPVRQTFGDFQETEILIS